jgi:hypothetical protein
MTTVRRIGLSFGCVLLSVALFSLRGIGHVTTVREFSTLIQFALIA